MKKKNILYLILTICLPLLYTSLGSNSNGITGKSTTSCTPCHGNNTNSATSVTIIGNIPSTGFVANQTYNMTIMVQNSNYAGSPNRSGFNLSVDQGTLVAGTGSSLSSGELIHSTPQTNSGATGTATWNFDWVAPATATSVTFSAAGNATNGNFGTSGDAHNTGTATFQMASTATAPTITNVTSTSITDVSATINAMVNANGASSTATVEYGLTTAYGSSAGMLPAAITGTTAIAASSNLTGLTANTTYHYRVTAINSAGTTNSPDGTFNTGFASSVEDLNKLKWETYPNPASEYIQIKLEDEINTSNLKLYTISGKKVDAAIKKLDSRTISINVSNLSKGIYILNMKINDKALSQRVVIK